ncbi:hypothetical protein Esti_001446 [Eimeria stiedai]
MAFASQGDSCWEQRLPRGGLDLSCASTSPSFCLAPHASMGLLSSEGEAACFSLQQRSYCSSTTGEDERETADEAGDDEGPLKEFFELLTPRRQHETGKDRFSRKRGSTCDLVCPSLRGMAAAKAPRMLRAAAAGGDTLEAAPAAADFARSVDNLQQEQLAASPPRDSSGTEARQQQQQEEQQEQQELLLSRCNVHGGDGTSGSSRSWEAFTRATSSPEESSIGSSPMPLSGCSSRSGCSSGSRGPPPGALRGGPRGGTGSRFPWRAGASSPVWLPEEDAVLAELVNIWGYKWSTIACAVNERCRLRRSGKQCRERWFNHVNPEVRRGGWTIDEDIYILRKQAVVGNRWAAIAKRLEGRTENAVKNRFISLTNRREQLLQLPPDLKGAVPSLLSPRNDSGSSSNSSVGDNSAADQTILSHLHPCAEQAHKQLVSAYVLAARANMAAAAAATAPPSRCSLGGKHMQQRKQQQQLLLQACVTGNWASAIRKGTTQAHPSWASTGNTASAVHSNQLQQEPSYYVGSTCSSYNGCSISRSSMDACRSASFVLPSTEASTVNHALLPPGRMSAPSFSLSPTLQQQQTMRHQDHQQQQQLVSMQQHQQQQEQEYHGFAPSAQLTPQQHDRHFTAVLPPTPQASIVGVAQEEVATLLPVSEFSGATTLETPQEHLSRAPSPQLAASGSLPSNDAVQQRNLSYWQQEQQQGQQQQQQQRQLQEPMKQLERLQQQEMGFSPQFSQAQHHAQVHAQQQQLQQQYVQRHGAHLQLQSLPLMQQHQQQHLSQLLVQQEQQQKLQLHPKLEQAAPNQRQHLQQQQRQQPTMQPSVL